MVAITHVHKIDAHQGVASSSLPPGSYGNWRGIRHPAAFDADQNRAKGFVHILASSWRIVSVLRVKHIARQSIHPALLRWSRILMCLLFALTVVVHMAYDMTAFAEYNGDIAVSVSSDADHGGMTKQSKAIDQCTYMGGCVWTLPPGNQHILVYPTPTMFAPPDDTISSGNIAGRLFRPPRSHSSA